MILTQADHAVLHAQHGLPSFRDAKSRALYNRAASALDHAMPVSFTVKGDLGTYRIRLNATSARQDGSDYSLAYANGYAMVKSKSKTGKLKTGAPGLVNLAGASGLTLDPILAAWALNINPLAQLANPEMKARSLGKAVIGGTSCDILEFRSTTQDLSLALRHSDALPIRIDSELRDKGGSVVASSKRMFSYASIRKPIPASAFVLH